MKKRTLLASLAIAAVLAACGKSEPAATSVGAAPAVTKIVVGLDDNFPPMGFRDEKNELVGFDVDMAKEATKRLGIEVEFKPIDWSAKEAELNGKRVDVLWNGLTILESRKQHIAFTDPYMANRQIIIVKAGTDITDKAGLAGKVVGVQEASSAVDAMKKDEAVFNSFKEFKQFGDNITALMDLETGRLDAVVVDEVVGRFHVAKKPDTYVVLEENFGTEDYGVGFRKDDTELLGKVNQSLKDMKADGAAAEISKKWFGENIVK